MKRLIALLLALLMCLSLCACGGGKSANSDRGDSTGKKEVIDEKEDGGDAVTLDSEDINDFIARTPEEAIEQYAAMNSYYELWAVFGFDPAETMRVYCNNYLEQKCNGDFEKLREDLLLDYPEDLGQLGSLEFFDADSTAYELLGSDVIDSYRSRLEKAASASELISAYTAVSTAVAAAYFDTEGYEGFSVANITKRELSGSEYSDCLRIITESMSEQNTGFHASADSYLVLLFTPADVNKIYAMSFNEISDGEADYWDEELYVAETAKGCFVFTLGA